MRLRLLLAPAAARALALEAQAFASACRRHRRTRAARTRERRPRPDLLLAARPARDAAGEPARRHGAVSGKRHGGRLVLSRRRAVAERTLGERGAAGRVGRVVSVDLGRTRVGVAHPLLDRAQRRAGGGHLGAERVAQLVEGEVPHLSAGQRVAAALSQLGGVEDVARRRVREDQVLVAAPVRALKVALELGSQAVGLIGTERPRWGLVLGRGQGPAQKRCLWWDGRTRSRW